MTASGTMTAREPLGRKRALFDHRPGADGGGAAAAARASARRPALPERLALGGERPPRAQLCVCDALLRARLRRHGVERARHRRHVGRGRALWRGFDLDHGRAHCVAARRRGAVRAGHPGARALEQGDGPQGPQSRYRPLSPRERHADGEAPFPPSAVSDDDGASDGAAAGSCEGATIDAHHHRVAVTIESDPLEEQRRLLADAPHALPPLTGGASAVVSQAPTMGGFFRNALPLGIAGGAAAAAARDDSPAFRRAARPRPRRRPEALAEAPDEAPRPRPPLAVRCGFTKCPRRCSPRRSRGPNRRRRLWRRRRRRACAPAT